MDPLTGGGNMGGSNKRATTQHIGEVSSKGMYFFLSIHTLTTADYYSFQGADRVGCGDVVADLERDEASGENATTPLVPRPPFPRLVAPLDLSAGQAMLGSSWQAERRHWSCRARSHAAARHGTAGRSSSRHGAVLCGVYSPSLIADKHKLARCCRDMRRGRLSHPHRGR